MTKTEALKAVISAIENGTPTSDHRGKVYRQQFGEAFLRELRKARDAKLPDRAIVLQIIVKAEHDHASDAEALRNLQYRVCALPGVAFVDRRHD